MMVRNNQFTIHVSCLYVYGKHLTMDFFSLNPKALHSSLRWLLFPNKAHLLLQKINDHGHPLFVAVTPPQAVVKPVM